MTYRITMTGFSLKIVGILLSIAVLTSACLTLFLSPPLVNAATIHDMGHSHNYNLRIDGAAASYAMASSTIIADVDNDGKNDLIIDATNDLDPDVCSKRSGSIQVK
jgi:PhoPQ-activated pathogenicity-related protein